MPTHVLADLCRFARSGGLADERRDDGGSACVGGSHRCTDLGLRLRRRAGQYDRAFTSLGGRGAPDEGRRAAGWPEAQTGMRKEDEALAVVEAEGAQAFVRFVELFDDAALRNRGGAHWSVLVAAETHTSAPAPTTPIRSLWEGFRRPLRATGSLSEGLGRPLGATGSLYEGVGGASSRDRMPPGPSWSPGTRAAACR